MRCVILCGGVGKRLRPLTDSVPKVMVRVQGEPMLTHILRGLKPYVTEVTLVVGYLKERIVDYYSSHFEGINIHYAVQSEFKGTAHALLCAEQYVDASFILVYGDTFFNPSIYKKLLTQSSDGVIVAKTVPNPSDFGVLNVVNGYLKNILEKVPNPPGNLINAGIYLLPFEVFNACKRVPLSPRNEYELTDAITLLISEGFTFKPVVINEWIDVGTLERLKQAEEMVF